MKGVRYNAIIQYDVIRSTPIPSAQSIRPYKPRLRLAELYNHSLPSAPISLTVVKKKTDLSLHTENHGFKTVTEGTDFFP
ncbi:hypothetical protein J6590_003893 [Homalodisca vitripennis]|nr:hypothetical protein J6590_003893 [Homalodisca vitripennis]